MIQLYKKGKFYGCEKLYFTELLYQQKRKQRERKENFASSPAPPTELLCDCVCILSVFLLMSLILGDPEPAQSMCNALWTLQKWPFTRSVRFFTAGQPVTQAWPRCVWTSVGLVHAPRHRAAPHGETPQLLFFARVGGARGTWSRGATGRLVLPLLHEALFIQCSTSEHQRSSLVLLNC